jgi:hypothetical protein
LHEGGKLSASLNGVTLVERTDDGTFNYLLNGWIGQNSSSTSFRGEITKADINSTLLSAYSAHIPTNERIISVSEWLQSMESALNKGLLVEIKPTERPLAVIAAQGIEELSTALLRPRITRCYPAADLPLQGNQKKNC